MVNVFEALFSPIKIGGYTLKNRIMNTGHAAHFQTGDGLPTQNYVDYVRERAKGGAGIIVTGHTVPHYDGEASLSLASYDDRITEVYKKFSEATHSFDVPILAQLGHRGRRVADAGAFLQRPTMAPSAIPAPDFSTPQLVPRAMTTVEVEETIQLFAAAASRVRKGGMDGVELSVGMDYLFANFLSHQANKRDDKYGGQTLEERATFLKAVLDVIRNELGPRLLLGVRFYDDLVEYSLRLEDYKNVAQILERDGKVDYFNMWQGIVPSPKSGRTHWPSHHYDPGQFSYLPAGLKEVVRLPVVGAGRIDSGSIANRMIDDGKADIIGMARALIADPHLPNKIKEGRVDEIRTCIACTQSCVGHIYLGMGVGCIYNPVTGREGKWGELSPASQKQKVVVVGGGPAGMEAARICAERGHSVVLFEQSKRVGGQIQLIMRTPSRQNFEEIILYFERQLERLGVDIRLDRMAGVNDVLEEEPDAVIIATGSLPFLPDVLGKELQHVLTARDVISGNAQIGQKVLVVDTLGRAEAATTAEMIADMGRDVEIVTGLEYVGRDISPPAWHPLMEQLMLKGVKLTPFTGVWEILEDSVEVYNVVTWEPRTLQDIDTVVLAAGGVADETLASSLARYLSNLHIIGDCYQARDIELAVTDGHRIAREI